MKKFNKTLYTLMFATSGTLLPYDIAWAESKWQCTPSADFRSWECLKDGKAPVEVIPAPVASEPTKADPAVIVTPLAAPEPIKPVASSLPENKEEAPVKAAPVAHKENIAPPPVQISEPKVEATPKAEVSPILSEAPTSPAEPEPPKTVAAPTVQPEETKKLTNTYAPLESPLISSDPTQRSCVAINRPLSAYGQNLTDLRKNAATDIEADDAQFEKDEKTVLSGNVTITRADQTLQSDKVVINKVTNQADAAGKVNYTDNQIQIKAEQAHLDFDTDENSFAEASFVTLERYSRGSAGQIQTQDGTTVKLDKVNYTTCPPGQTSWELDATQITLDDESGRGEAREVKLDIFGVPVMYVPYMTFPIDDRRLSGLLTPRFSHSDDRGNEIIAPIYWNIAPDKDATFYPRYMSERGLQLGGEYRYLNENNNGQINLEYLADDDEYLGPGSNDRWGFKYEHQGKVFNGWTLDTELRRVSDDQYFEDLGSSLALSSQTHLDSHLKISKHSDNWSLHGLFQNYQTVDSTIADINKPYERLPQVRFNYWTDPFAERFTARVDTTYTDFDRKNSVTGKRTSIYPSITYNYDRGGYYVRPKLGVHYTRYSLSNQVAGMPSSPNRSVPIFSVDSGLFYEKQTTLFGQNMLQTLEPRIYYLKVSEKNQTNIPIFDSGLFDFSSSALFRENRFSGLDRIGDTNQVSVGITSRFLDGTDGSEKLSATLGQIYYFSDRDVTLPGGAVDKDSSSPIIAELRYHPYRQLVASAQLHWDPETSKTERGLFRLKYQPEDDKILNLAYRYRDQLLKQTDVSFLWPMGDSQRWHAVGRWNYSLSDEQTLDSFGGLEYESCCWKTRIVARRWVNDVNSDYDTGIFIELELKGLGSIGDDVSSFLETGILGYDRHINDQDDDTYYY